MNREDKLAKLRETAQTYIKEASKLEKERVENLAYLRSIPLWNRVFNFSRYTVLRRKIKDAEVSRSQLVLLSLGVTRLIRRLERTK